MFATSCCIAMFITCLRCHCFETLALHLPSPSPCSGVVPRGVNLVRALREEKVHSRQREMEQHHRRRMSDSSVSIIIILSLNSCKHSIIFYHCPFGMLPRALLSLLHLSNSNSGTHGDENLYTLCTHAEGPNEFVCPLFVLTSQLQVNPQQLSYLQYYDSSPTRRPSG